MENSMESVREPGSVAQNVELEDIDVLLKPNQKWKVIMTHQTTDDVVVEDVETRDGGFDAMVRASLRYSGHSDEENHMFVQCATCGDEVVFTNDEAKAPSVSSCDLVRDFGETIKPVGPFEYANRVLARIAAGDESLRHNILAAFSSIIDDWTEEGLDETRIMRRALSLDYFDGFSSCICPQAYY